jgi:prevent-host-death family protein
MKVMTAKELKNRTGEALCPVKRGEKVLVTVHGKPRAVLSPAGEASVSSKGEKKFDEA